MRGHLYHPEYGGMDERWAKVCMPYADRLKEVFPPDKRNTYIAVVDDDRGVFICVNDRQFDAPDLETAFQAAIAYIKSPEYIFDWERIHPTGF